MILEYHPEANRGSHVAAGNLGIYPYNGAVRLWVSRLCAEEIVGLEVEPGGWEWARIVAGL